jgi:hypothetical protein
MHGRTGVQAPAAHRPHTRSQSTRKKHPAGPCGGSRRAWWISSRLHTRHHTFTAPPSIHLNSLCQAQAYDCCIRSLALTRTYPAHMARAQLLVLLVVCGLAAASAFPYLFVNEYAKTCTSHPEKAHAGHGAPTADRTPVYALRDSKNALVRVACPGGKYQLTVSQLAYTNRALGSRPQSSRLHEHMSDGGATGTGKRVPANTSSARMAPGAACALACPPHRQH